MIIPILALVTVTFSPPAPTVGDPITIEFAGPATLDPSSEYEVLSDEGTRVVVRTFAPKAFAMSGITDGVRFRNLRIPVKSVLKPNDDLKPAPLTAPAALAYPRRPFYAIAAAALLALIAWLVVWRLSRRRAEEIVPAIPADEKFRRAVLALQSDERHPRRWAALADATRDFLAATRPGLGSELTTSELVPRLRGNELVIEEILRQGDLEKFSPWGAAPRDFDEIATRALQLIEPAVELAA